MGKAKRVRFMDDENGDFVNSGRNNSSNREDLSENRIIDGPKTSEYAFFKKIKKDAGRSFISSKPEVGEESKRAECYNHQPGQPVGGPSLFDKLKNRNPDTKVSSLAGKERNAKPYSFISPLNVVPTKLATKRHTGTLDKIERSNSSLLPGNVTPVDCNVFFSPTTSASANEGNQNFGKGVFAEKRQKLHQQAVDTLFPELGEGCSKGFPMVSKLLHRLFPKGCENDDTRLVERTMDATDHLSTLSTSYNSQKKVHLVHKNTSMDLENDSSFADILPTSFHGITKKDLASEREDYLAIYDTRANFLEYEADPQLIGRYQKCNSSSWFPYEKMRTKSFYIQELDDYTDPSKFRKREPHNFLLDWDFGREKEKDELHLPARDVEDCTYSNLSISRIGQNQQFIGDRLDKIEFPSWSFPRIYPKYDLMPYWQPNYFDTQNARRLLEYGHQEDLEPRESPSTLSLIPKYLTLAEDRGVHDVLECEDSPTLCFQENPWCITDVSSHRQHAVEPLLLSGGLGIEMSWKCLSLSSPPDGRQLTSYYSSHFPHRELSTSYLPDEGEFDPGLHTSNSRKTNDLFSEDAFTHQDCSVNDRRQLTSYYSSQFPQRELSTSYLLDEGEFDPGLHTSKSRKTNVLFSEDAFTHQDCSITDILDRELDCHSLINSSCWDEPYAPKEDDYN